jgi:hypothetical protein
MSDEVRHEERPELYTSLLAPFALRRHERWLGRVLVSLAAIPGVVRLLAAWHGRRAQK